MKHYVSFPDRKALKVLPVAALREHGILVFKRWICQKHFWGSRKPLDLGLPKIYQTAVCRVQISRSSTICGARELGLFSSAGTGVKVAQKPGNAHSS